MPITQTEINLVEVIDAAIKTEIGKIVESVIADAQKEVQTRINGEVDKIVLGVSQYYEVERQGVGLVVRVSKPDQ